MAQLQAWTTFFDGRVTLLGQANFSPYKLFCSVSETITAFASPVLDYQNMHQSCWLRGQLYSQNTLKLRGRVTLLSFPEQLFFMTQPDNSFQSESGYRSQEVSRNLEFFSRHLSLSLHSWQDAGKSCNFLAVEPRGIFPWGFITCENPSWHHHSLCVATPPPRKYPRHNNHVS